MHRKCDEKKPSCAACVRGKKTCSYGLKLSWGGRPFGKSRFGKCINESGNLKKVDAGGEFFFRSFSFQCFEHRDFCLLGRVLIWFREYAIFVCVWTGDEEGEAADGEEGCFKSIADDIAVAIVIAINGAGQNDGAGTTTICNADPAAICKNASLEYWSQSGSLFLACPGAAILNRPLP